MPKAIWNRVVLAEAPEERVENVEGNVYSPPEMLARWITPIMVPPFPASSPSNDDQCDAYCVNGKRYIAIASAWEGAWLASHRTSWVTRVARPCSYSHSRAEM